MDDQSQQPQPQQAPPKQYDFTDKYNTTLAPSDETKFQGWMQDQSKGAGYDVPTNLYDYDLRGWWQKNQTGSLADPEVHLDDIWKKPNHPTFSQMSQYHGVDDWHGGEWKPQPDGSFSFTPGETNMMTPAALADYFKKVEPGNQLLLPQQGAQ